MSSPTQLPDLTKILTPDLYDKVLANRFPYSRTEPLDFAQVGTPTFRPSPETVNEYTAIVLPALKAISQYREHPSILPSLLTFLPPPKSPSFPPQALALTLLIDQGPRHSCSGLSERWLHYFDPISQSLAQSFRSLPPSLQPFSKERWLNEQGVSYDFYLVTQLFWHAPFIHSENLELHKICAGYLEELRIDVENETGSKDPLREERNTVMGDLWESPRMYREGPPSGEGVRKEDYTFWWMRIMDVHYCIIEKFGRYPYRNRGAGRESSDEEKEWVRKAEGFGEVSEEVGRRVKEDIEKGVWSPIGAE